MKIERTKNATRNIIFGGLLKVYQILMPFLMRTAMIYFLGVEYLGLNGLFTSILQVLNMAELGVGSAMIYSMYKPIAQDDKYTICSLMRMYKIYYRIIGIVIALLGIAIIPLVPIIAKKDVPDDINIYILYLLNLAATVLTYWLFAYKNCLLTAHQRSDITSKITIIMNTVQYLLQFIVLYTLHSYYLYLLITLFVQIINNITISIIVSKKYPEYTPKGKLEPELVKKINQRIKDLFTAKLGGTVVHSADTIVISTFLGLTILAMYQNYYFVMTSVIGVIGVIFSACTAGIGNSLVTETIDKNYYDYRKLTFLITWIATVCVCCFASMFQPFIMLWVGKDYMLDMWAVVLFCIYFYLYVINNLACVYKDAAGIWHEDRFRPLIGALVNLVLNISLVKFLGIYAVLLSTILSYIFVAMPWLICNLFKILFKRSPKEYIFELLRNAIATIVIATLNYVICISLPLSGVLSIVINCIISLFTSNVFLILLYRKNPMYNSTIDLLNKITKEKFKFVFSKLRYDKKES